MEFLLGVIVCELAWLILRDSRPWGMIRKRLRRVKFFSKLL